MCVLGWSVYELLSRLHSRRVQFCVSVNVHLVL
jgi:hypothetical protein